MSLQHWLVWIGFVVTLRALCVSDVIHESYGQQPFGFAAVDMQSLVKLPAVLGQFKSSAHLCSLRSLFIRDKLTSIPVGRDFLIAVVFGFLQLPPVCEENKFAVMIIRQIDFRILERETQRIRRANQLLQPFVTLRVPTAVAAPPVGSATAIAAGISTARIAPTRVPSAGVAPAAWVTTTRVASPVTTPVTTPITNLCPAGVLY